MLTNKRLDINDAHTLIAAARDKAHEIGVPVSIAITDEAGNLIAFERMNDARITSVTLAIDKAFTASGLRKSTHLLAEANQPGQPAHGISSAMGGRIIAIAGGHPVFSGSEVVGGVGVSSGTPAQDQAIAEAAIDAFSSIQT